MNSSTLPDPQKYSAKLIFLIILLYLFRLAFCYSGYLTNYQWVSNTDETHIYLTGLQYYTSHQYPYWGPDIVYTQSYLIGGLQGLLVGIPLFIWHHPFAPYLFLYIMLSIGLLYLSWYISKLFPTVKRWIVYSFIALSPFSIHTGLHVVNPAYVLCFAIPFMLSVVETFSLFKNRYIHPRWRFFWMGLGITSVFQLHGSWAFLCILGFFAVVYYWFNNPKGGLIIKSILFGLSGLIVGFLPVIPVFIHFGSGVFLQQARVIDFSMAHITDLFSIVFYFITSCGYEMNFFSKEYTWNSLIHYRDYTGAGLFLILQIAGFGIFILEIVMPAFKKWRAYIISTKRFLFFIGAVILILSIAFMFSYERPRAHALIAIYPISAIYFFWFLNNLFRTVKIRNSYPAIFLGMVVCYYGLLIIITSQLPELKYRKAAFEAIAKKDAAVFEKPRYVYPTPIR